LIRRDAKDSSKDFLGLPVPAAAGTVASLVLALLSLAESDRDIHRWAVVLPPLLVLIAVLMVSTVRYPSGKKVDLQTSTRLSTFVLVVSVAGVLVLFKEFGLLACTLSYIFFGLIRHWRRARVARKQSMPGSV
jgi:CDP-diacylglycerol--serine O-phosphatidyltransferase